MFKIFQDPIVPETLKNELLDQRAGAYASFEGWVRDTNEGKAVKRLDYEVYSVLAEKEGSKIIEEALSKFDILSAACVHRVGHLELGDMAVWVGVVAGHRDAAFVGCRYVIDEVKKRVPIWKKEFYLSDDSGWIANE